MVRSIEVYAFVISGKLSWGCDQVLIPWLYWVNHLILSGTRNGGYWIRFIVVFHSQLSRIITIISADLAEFGPLDTDLHRLLTNTQNCTFLCNMTVTMYKVPWLFQTNQLSITSGNGYPVTKNCISTNINLT
jgi:hypothetical protein